jgi:CheY-like chemotaxis protein
MDYESIPARIVWCQRQKSQACAPGDIEGWQAEEEGLRDALFNKDHTNEYRTYRPRVFKRYLEGLQDGLALIALQRLNNTRNPSPIRKAEQSMETRAAEIIRILLVDDVARIRQSLRSILATYPNFEVVGEACDGIEALRAVKLFRPSVVVMDISMPRLNGIEATALLKEIYPHVVIVGLSIYANEDTRQAMIAAGATTVVSKETAVEQLRDEIIESVNRRSTASH